MHDAGNTVKSRFFFLTDVSVSFKEDVVAFSFDDSVDDDVASDVAYEGYSAGADIAVSPRTEGDLVSHVDDAWIHAVAGGSYGHSVAFSNEFAGFFEHSFCGYGNML